jgi:hypothetical protein
MSRILTTILIALTAWQIRSAETAVAPLTPDCRYLFIVDTSLSMTRLQENIAASVSRVITSGLDGQMAPGEVFTIWTFNEDVQQHEFPLTSWTPNRGTAMGERVSEFLRSRRFRREADMRALINGIYQAKRFCPRLAVFLITNGEQVLVGTPFDRQINVIYGRRFEELRGARVPFITTLICQNGEIVGWNNSAANEPLDVPNGPDGSPVVGRRRQPLSTQPAPVPSDARSPSLGPVTNRLSLTEKEPRTAKPAPAVVPVPPDPPPSPVPANGRKVVELKPTIDPDAPKVVKPTEIAPKPKVELPKLPFTKPKTDPLSAIPPEAKPKPATPAPAVAPKPAPAPTASNAPTNRVATPSREPVADPPVEIDDNPPRSEAKRPAPTAATTYAPPLTAKAPPVVRVKPSPEPPVEDTVKPTTNRPPDVVLAASSPSPTIDGITNKPQPLTIITQVINVAFPQKPKPKTADVPPTPSTTNTPARTVAAPSPSPAQPTTTTPAARPFEPAPLTSTTNHSPEKAVTADQPAPSPTNASPDPDTFSATPQTPASNFAGAPVPSPREPAPRRNETLAITSTDSRDPVQWIYLGAAVVLLILAGFTGWKLLTPPIDASLISKSMEDRDNG